MCTLHLTHSFKIHNLNIIVFDWKIINTHLLEFHFTNVTVTERTVRIINEQEAQMIYLDTSETPKVNNVTKSK